MAQLLLAPRRRPGHVSPGADPRRSPGKEMEAPAWAGGTGPATSSCSEEVGKSLPNGKAGLLHVVSPYTSKRRNRVEPVVRAQNPTYLLPPHHENGNSVHEAEAPTP